jgi:hypothetical protein
MTAPLEARADACPRVSILAPAPRRLGWEEEPVLSEAEFDAAAARQIEHRKRDEWLDGEWA